MHISRVVFPSVVFLTFLVSAQAQPPATSKPADRLSDSPPEPQTDVQLLISPEFFPILPWDTQHGWGQPPIQRKYGLASIAECGFTMAGFVRPEDLPACEKLGLRAIVTPSRDEPHVAKAWRELNDEQIEAAVKRMIDRAANSPAIAGYFLADEPGTPAFPALAKAVAAVKKHAPGKLAYINLFPGYATIGAPDKSQLGASTFTEYLERYVADVKPQFISYDNYAVQSSDDLAKKRESALYFGDLLEVRRVSMAHRLPFWNIVASNQIRPQFPPPSPANLLLQGYTTLAAGGRGVSWYTYYGGHGGRGYGHAPIDANGEKTETWGYLRAINEQLKRVGPIMNRLQSTGVYFSSPTIAPGLPMLPGKLARTVQSRSSITDKTAPELPIMVGEFAGPEGEYVMIVNLSLQHAAHVKLQWQTAGRTASVLSAADGRWMPWGENGRWFVAGQGVLVRLK